MALSREICFLFFEETEKDLRAIEAHAKDDQWTEVSLLAHRIRGRARVMNFAEFEGLCADVETHANGGEYAGIGPKIDSVNAALAARRKTEIG